MVYVTVGAAPERIIFGLLVFTCVCTTMNADAAVGQTTTATTAATTVSMVQQRFLMMDGNGQGGGTDYTHVDKSQEFSALEKYIIVFIWFLPLVVARMFSCFRQRPLSSHDRAVLYVGASLLMVECRAWFYANMVATEEEQEQGRSSSPSSSSSASSHQHPRSFDGPAYNVMRSVPWEPVLMLWASFVLQACLKSAAATTATASSSRQRQLPPNHRYLHLLWTTLQSALWIQHEDDIVNEDWITTMARTLGSTLTLTGSVANTLMGVLSYDVMTYASVTRDLAVPVTLALVALMFLSATGWHGAANGSMDNYSQGGYSSLDPTVAESSSSFQEENDYHDLELVVSNSKASSPSALQEDSEVSCPLDSTDIIAGDIKTTGTGQGNYVADGIPTVQHPSDEQGWMSLAPTTTTGTLTCFLSIGMSLLYFADYNFLSVAVGGAFLVLLYKSIKKDSDGSENHAIASLDYPTLLCYIGEFILVGSLNDTGLPQQFFSTALGACADQIYGESDICMFRRTTVFGLAAAIISPPSAMLMTEATFPYGSPYTWIQVTWAVGIAGKCLCHPSRFRRQWFVTVLPFTLVTMYAGTWLIAVFHTSRECSLKLGEC